MCMGGGGGGGTKFCKCVSIIVFFGFKLLINLKHVEATSRELDASSVIFKLLH